MQHYMALVSDSSCVGGCSGWLPDTFSRPSVKSNGSGNINGNDSLGIKSNNIVFYWCYYRDCICNSVRINFEVNHGTTRRI